MPANMNFSEFSAYKTSLLERAVPLLDASETRIVPSLGALATSISALTLPKKAHRCHLAEFWLDNFQLERSLKPRTLISRGVRHSLSLLFQLWAREAKVALLPNDVYPVYRQLADDFELEVEEYSMWPGAERGTDIDADVILVTNPAKPRGTALTENEVLALEQWLRRNPERRLVIDAVYNFDAPLDAATLRLMQTDQVIVIHSLSKSWVRPLVMGVALVPEQDVESLTPIFRAAPPGQYELQLAQALLTQDGDFPVKLVAELARRRDNLQAMLHEHGCGLNLEASVPTYLFVVEMAFEKMLDRHGVLGIPLSVFGRDAQRHCVLSSLAFGSTSVGRA
jgi:aspartate/methionine/tyrosine aminotransferase